MESDHAEGVTKNDEKYYKRIFYLCEYMEGLIDDLLNFAKLQKHEFIIKRVDLSKMIDEIKEVMTSSLLKEDIDIHIVKDLPKLVCDEVSVKEVFRNLIANAIKYNDQDKKIIEIGWDEAIAGTKLDRLRAL